MSAQQQQRPDPFADFGGMLERVDQINARLEALSARCHLCSPSTTCALPPGCAVSFTMVRIDPSTESHSVGGGKRSLLRTALLKLANAAGISWDARASGRADPGTDPRVVHWHAAGAWRALDGTVLPVVGDCQMDLRDGSDQALEILANSRGDTAGEREAKGRRTLLATRAKILEHAQSKAELRAIRKALAIRGYTEAELREKPFAVVRLVYLGHDEDPEIERENKRAIRGQMLGGMLALFGPPVQEQAPRMLAPVPTVHALPPASNIPDAEVDDDAPHEQDPAPAATPHEPTPASAPTSRSGFQIPGGRNKGAAIEDADDRDLSYWAGRISEDLDAGKTKPAFRERDEALARAIRAEQGRRAGGGEELRPEGGGR